MRKKALLSIITAFMLLVSQVTVVGAAGPGPDRQKQDKSDHKQPAKKSPPKSESHQARPQANKPHQQDRRDHKGPAHQQDRRDHKGPAGKPHQAPHQQSHRPPAHNPHQAPHGYNRYKSSPSMRSQHGQFRPGHRIPAYYHTHHSRYVVSDWRGRGLYEPPHGHHWLLVDGNFVLAAIGTGIIANILLGH